MGCCSGNTDSTSKGSLKTENNLYNPGSTLYTYIPGAVKHTDYTRSQARTGWTTEADRKRDIIQSNYYKPSYVVLVNHGKRKSPVQSKSSSFSTLTTTKGKKEKEFRNEAIYAIPSKKSRPNNNNYFGTGSK